MADFFAFIVDSELLNTYSQASAGNSRLMPAPYKAKPGDICLGPTQIKEFSQLKLASPTKVPTFWKTMMRLAYRFFCFGSSV